MAPNTEPTVAFVLSGGASLGAVQVGMLRALYERDIAPDVVVGTSAGAVNGAFIVSRRQAVETADELAEVGAAFAERSSSRSTRSPGCSAFSAPATTSCPSQACGG